MLTPQIRLPPAPPHLLLLVWVGLTGLVTFGTVVALDQGLIQQMLAADRSQICIVVIGMYLIGLGHTFVRTRFLSTELARADELVTRVATSAPQSLRITADALQFADGQMAPAGFVADYLREARCGPVRTTDVRETTESELLEAYASRVRSANEFGWYYIDLMLKVGFLGTLVGFILMLSSVADTGSLDATTMQKVLKQMSLGMSTALYTTLASLVGGILLSLPYYLLDRGLERLLQLAIYAQEVLLPSRLNTQT